MQRGVERLGDELSGGAVLGAHESPGTAKGDQSHDAAARDQRGRDSDAEMERMHRCRPDRVGCR